MFVAATSRCFADLPLDGALQRLVDLEYTCVEIMIHEDGGHLKPSAVASDLDAAVRACRQTHRLTPVAFSFDTYLPDSDPKYYEQFVACCKLAKASKVVTITVRSSELGTPFNAEVERLRMLSAIAQLEGVRVGLLSEAGRMTQDPDTAVVLCDTVKGMGISLDPSHYIFGPHRGNNYEQVLKYVYHVRLRDTNQGSTPGSRRPGRGGIRKAHRPIGPVPLRSSPGVSTSSADGPTPISLLKCGRCVCS